ncbi:MAG: ribosome maturation factor RimP [Eubacteriales bacterium]|nr:ribosome maturation factor RimP [Eubacteriales bacterium]MDD4582681.1 ribosome maturation factor RimP [Eubacteriales bacterium]
MKKKKITELVKEELRPFLEQENYQLYNIEFIKEGKEWYLRIFIEKAPGSDRDWPENVSTDDCEKVSRYISEKLDLLDPIDQNYYLEVSSPGMDRLLLKDEDYKRYQGQLVDIKLYKSIDGKKNITGKLLGICEGYIDIEDEKGNPMHLSCENVSMTRLTIVF